MVLVTHGEEFHVAIPRTVKREAGPEGYCCCSAVPAGRWIRYQVDSARSAVINDITGERREEASLSSLQVQHVYSPKHNEVFFTHRREDKETYYSDVTDAKNVIYRESLPLGATTLPPQS